MQREDCLAEMYWWGVDFYFIKLWWQRSCICVQLSASFALNPPPSFFFSFFFLFFPKWINQGSNQLRTVTMH